MANSARINNYCPFFNTIRMQVVPARKSCHFFILLESLFAEATFILAESLISGNIWYHWKFLWFFISRRCDTLELYWRATQRHIHEINVKPILIFLFFLRMVDEIIGVFPTVLVMELILIAGEGFDTFGAENFLGPERAGVLGCQATLFFNHWVFFFQK